MTTKLKFLKSYFSSIWDGNFIEFFKKPIATSAPNKSLHYKISTNNVLNNGSETLVKNNIRDVSGTITIIDNLYSNGFAPTKSIPYLQQISNPPTVYTVSTIGGRITYDGTYKSHYFDYNSAFTDKLTTFTSASVRTLMYAGGASGGNGGGTSGGGGGGGDIDERDETLAIGSYPAVIGQGGQITTFKGNDGGDTIFNGRTIEGGSYGNGNTVPPAGGSGTIGGGGGSYGDNIAVGGAGGVGTKFNGGSATAYNAGNAAGGGGGAGGNGGNAVGTAAGAGGLGVYSSITGTTIGYCGGGAGSADLGGAAGDAAVGFGGGDGNIRGGRLATDGVRGGGGGGSNSGGTAGKGGNGGIIVRVPHTGIVSTSTEIFAPSASYTRWDGSCVIKLADNSYLMGVQVFGTGSGDFSGARIEFYTSTDLTNWTYLSRIDPIFTSINVLLPCLKQRANGDIVCVYFELVSTTTSRMLMRTSNDLGNTWSALSVLRENSGEYLNFYPREIFVTDTDRWVIPFEVAGNSDLQQGPYIGYTFYSDDELRTAPTLSGSTITGAGNQCLESGYVKIGSNIGRYFRTYDGLCYMAISSDNSVSHGTPYNTNLPTISAYANKPSTTTIKKLTNGHYIAFYNNTDRTTAEIAYSLDGIDFSTYYTINTVSGEQLIQADIVENGNYVHIFYSISSLSQARFSLYCYKLKLDTYA